MEVNINGLVRSAVVLAIGLPVSLAATFALNQRPVPNYATRTTNLIKAGVIEDCLKWAVSKPDSKLERAAQDGIDETLGEDGVDYQQLCKWAL